MLLPFTVLLPELAVTVGGCDPAGPGSESSLSQVKSPLMVLPLVASACNVLQDEEISLELYMLTSPLTLRRAGKETL